LFSNTEHATRRRNLTIKMSCDDGQTWPSRKAVEPGASAYSTLTPLDGERFGLLYEKANETTGRVEAIRFVILDRAWLGTGCPAS
jgi:sialidase-1